MQQATDIPDLSAWIGRTEKRTDTLEPTRTRALQAALGGPQAAEGDALPLLHHWLYFWDPRRPDETGPDGHPKRGAFLPPVAAPRRMWAAGRLRFHAPLRIGETVERTSEIAAIEVKTGRTGPLTFLEIDHRLVGPSGLAIEERQTIVYREAGGPQKLEPGPGAAAADWRETVAPDPVLLFRYSALTLNSHRIHYDRPYATAEEGYPGLVVHGPLQATLMLAAAQHATGGDIRAFEFRGMSPAIDGVELSIGGVRTAAGAELFVEQDGRCTMSGKAEWGS